MKVESSVINSVTYSNKTLIINFNNGHVYMYTNIPKVLYERMLIVGSKGKFFNYNIKGHYKFEKIA